MPSHTIPSGPSYRGSATQERRVCPHCNIATVFDFRDQRRISPDLSDNLAVGRGAVVKEHVWQCSYCSEVVLELAVYAEAPAEMIDGAVHMRPPVEVRSIWPIRSRRLDAAVPAPIRSLFEEASLSEYAGALRNAAGGYRATVEEICRDQQAPGANLYNKIEALAGQGLDQDVVAAMHEARMLGNESLHAGVTFAADEVADVAELIQEVVHVLYIVPAQRAAMRQARLQRTSAGSAT